MAVAWPRFFSEARGLLDPPDRRALLALRVLPDLALLGLRVLMGLLGPRARRGLRERARRDRLVL